MERVNKNRLRPPFFMKINKHYIFIRCEECYLVQHSFGEVHDSTSSHHLLGLYTNPFSERFLSKNALAQSYSEFILGFIFSVFENLFNSVLDDIVSSRTWLTFPDVYPDLFKIMTLTVVSGRWNLFVQFCWSAPQLL